MKQEEKLLPSGQDHGLGVNVDLRPNRPLWHFRELVGRPPIKTEVSADTCFSVVVWVGGKDRMQAKLKRKGYMQVPFLPTLPFKSLNWEEIFDIRDSLCR